MPTSELPVVGAVAPTFRDFAGSGEVSGVRFPDLEIVLDLADSDWDAYVDEHPRATGYHLTRWRRVFESAFRHRGRYLAARRRGRVVGVMPIVVLDTWLFGRFGVSLPFVNYGGVVADDDAAAHALLEAASLLVRTEKWRYVEIRHVGQRFSELPCKTHKVGMTLSLPNFEPDLWNLIDRKVRNQIRKAEKSGCIPMIGGLELLDAFYEVFAHNMRDLGTPVYDKAFFRQVLEAFPNRTRVFIVTIDGRPAAASLVFRWRKTVEVPWASALREFRTQNPNMLLYWEMLRWCVQEHVHTFDFGRSTRDGGTYAFKRQWGAQPTQLHWEYWMANGGALPDQNPKNTKYTRAVAAWQKLPIWLTNRLGPHIVRMFP